MRTLYAYPPARGKHAPKPSPPLFAKKELSSMLSLLSESPYESNYHPHGGTAMLKKRLMLLTALIAAAGTLQAATLRTGNPAPEFTLTDTAGNAHDLSDFRGKFVVLEWINHGCPFVVKHYSEGHMQALQKEFTGKDVIWLSICSSAEGKQGYLTNEEWNATNEEMGSAPTAVLIDEDGTVGKLYDARTTPHMYVIDPEGTLIYQGAIDDKRSTDAADIANSKNYVRAALEAAMAGQPVENPQTQPYGCSVKYKN
jgi:hypothetical protein